MAQLKGIELRHRLDEADESLVRADGPLLTLFDPYRRFACHCGRTDAEALQVFLATMSE
ncbi:hypothetical protein NUH87_16375 [Pseudomonas batumici]|uniref:hypothetical protein n=1 Tax=Pseudomonas batumici TaxID=226910 RepID=UPI0030CD397B